ncbi:MAG: caspase family protein [Candidatus Electrothrix sp. AR1]|nr:caspase family protein [Candidatus Electrothrix sp. AR1]
MMNRYIITVLLLLVGHPVWAVNPSRYFGKSYAVVIGIRNYQQATTWKELKYAEKDAKAMADLLRRQGFEVRLFIGREATKNNIISYLADDLATRLSKGDRIVFYFSGHGETQKLGGSDFGYIIPYEGTNRSATWISMEKLRELAKKLGYARHQLFIFDSCFGGLFATKGALTSRPEDTPNYVAEVAHHFARQYLTAGGANEQTPADSQLYGYREHSHYTAYLLKGLEGAADTYRDGVITASELNAYLGPAATSNFNKPRGDSFPGHEQGNFLFRSPLPATIKGGTIFTSETKGILSSDDEAHDWERFSDMGIEGLNFYLFLYPYGKWANEARSRLGEENIMVLIRDKKWPLNAVELNYPNTTFSFPSIGKKYQSGATFSPPKTIDCSNLALKTDSFKDAIKAGALFVRINTPQQIKSIVKNREGESVTEAVKIKPVYGGVLALCNVSKYAKGPDSRSYNIRGLDDYLIMSRNGKISVVGAVSKKGELTNLVEKTSGYIVDILHQFTDSNDYSWMLWLTDRPTIFTNYEAELASRKDKRVYK